MHVLGSAGHVDHGKSTILRALTGMEPDRLPEEKKRGMTIDLNFVWAKIGDEEVGFIDVPGHHRFVKNMITGAMNIDAFLFVVAADDGWMPQSEEHLGVLKHLQVKQGIAVISKRDLVSAERFQEVDREVREKFGQSIPILSYATGESAAPIKAAVERLLKELPKPVTTKAPRIWIDRVFQPKGQGTVITGTLREGPLKVGDVLYASPGGKKCFVKQIQQYAKPIDEVFPVSRVALQLSERVDRGMILEGVRGSEARVVDVSLKYFSAIPSKNQKLNFHIGTEKRPVLVIPLGPDAARLKFESPIRLRFGDAFLLRAAGEEKTLAGGQIVDSEPTERAHHRAKALLKTWNSGCAGTLKYLLARQGFVDFLAFERNSIWSLEEIQSEIEKADLLRVGQQVVLDRNRAQKLLNDLLREMKKGHSEGKEDFSKASLVKWARQEQALSPQALGYVLAVAEHLKKIEKDGEKYRVRGHQRKIETWEQDALLLLSRLAQESKKPFSIKSESISEERLRQTAERHPERFVSLDPGWWMGASAYRELSQGVLAHLTQKGEASSSELKEVMGLSRKPAVMILERMDRDRMTFLKDGIRKRMS